MAEPTPAAGLETSPDHPHHKEQEERDDEDGEDGAWRREAQRGGMNDEDGSKGKVGRGDGSEDHVRGAVTFLHDGAVTREGAPSGIEANKRGSGDVERAARSGEEGIAGGEFVELNAVVSVPAHRVVKNGEQLPELAEVPRPQPSVAAVGAPVTTDARGGPSAAGRATEVEVDADANPRFPSNGVKGSVASQSGADLTPTKEKRSQRQRPPPPPAPVAVPGTNSGADANGFSMAQLLRQRMEPPGRGVLSTPRKKCNCKNSRCLKLYCECFASGNYCDGCNCQNCQNNLEHEAVRQEAVEATLDRNPNAFRPKIAASPGHPSAAMFGRNNTNRSDMRRHNKGCHCKKSHCLKKYCECFQAGVYCSENCKCQDCKNCPGGGNPPLFPENIRSGMNPQQLFGAAGVNSMSGMLGSSVAAAAAGVNGEQAHFHQMQHHLQQQVVSNMPIIPETDGEAPKPSALEKVDATAAGLAATAGNQPALRVSGGNPAFMKTVDSLDPSDPIVANGGADATRADDAQPRQGLDHGYHTSNVLRGMPANMVAGNYPQMGFTHPAAMMPSLYDPNAFQTMASSIMRPSLSGIITPSVLESIRNYIATSSYAFEGHGPEPQQGQGVGSEDNGIHSLRQEPMRTGDVGGDSVAHAAVRETLSPENSLKCSEQVDTQHDELMCDEADALGAMESERPLGADGDKEPEGSEDTLEDDELGARLKRRKMESESQQVNNTYSLQEEGILKATLQCFEAIISKQSTEYQTL